MQQIGLRHYDDFNERMMREEVEEIEIRVITITSIIVHLPACFLTIAKCVNSYFQYVFYPSTVRSESLPTQSTTVLRW